MDLKDIRVGRKYFAKDFGSVGIYRVKHVTKDFVIAQKCEMYVSLSELSPDKFIAPVPRHLIIRISSALLRALGRGLAAAIRAALKGTDNIYP